VAVDVIYKIARSGKYLGY